MFSPVRRSCAFQFRVLANQCQQINVLDIGHGRVVAVFIFFHHPPLGVEEEDETRHLLYTLSIVERCGDRSASRLLGDRIIRVQAEVVVQSDPALGSDVVGFAAPSVRDVVIILQPLERFLKHLIR